MGMKNVTVKTVVNEKFRFKATDLNGSVFVFEERHPSVRRDTLFFPEIGDAGSSLNPSTGSRVRNLHLAVSPSRSTPPPHGSLDLVEEGRSRLSQRRTAAGRDPRTPHSWNYAVDPCRSPGALGLPPPISACNRLLAAPRDPRLAPTDP